MALTAGDRLDRKRDHVGIEQHGEICRYDLVQGLEAGRRQQRQYGLMDARLAREIGATGGDQGAMLVLEPRDLGLKPLQHELLHVDDACTALLRWGRQDVQEVRMLRQEIRILTKVCRDLRRAELGRTRVLAWRG